MAAALAQYLPLCSPQPRRVRSTTGAHVRACASAQPAEERSSRPSSTGREQRSYTSRRQRRTPDVGGEDDTRQSRSPQAPPPGRDAKLQNADLHRRLCSSQDPGDVLATVEAISQREGADAVASLAFHRLAVLCTRQPEQQAARVLADPRRALLARLVTAALPRLSGLQLSDVLWAHTKLALWDTPATLVAVAAPHVLCVAQQGGTLQELANIVWALVRGAPSEGATGALLHDLAPLLASRLDATSQESAATGPGLNNWGTATGRAVAMLCWSYGTACTSRHEALLTSLAAAALRLKPWLTSQGLCHVAWGLARMGNPPVEVLLAMGDAWVDTHTAAPIDAATLMYALAQAGCRNVRVVNRVRDLVMSPGARAHLTRDARAVPSLAWSLATLTYGAADSMPAGGIIGGALPGIAPQPASTDAAAHDTHMWASLESLLAECAPHLDAHGLAMAACALTTARQDSPHVLSALATAALPKIQDGHFSAQQISMLAFALGCAPDVAATSQEAAVRDVMAALLASVDACRPAWHTWSDRELANAAWGLAVGGIPTWRPAFVRLRGALALRAKGMEAMHLAQMHQVEQLAAMQVADQQLSGADELPEAVSELAAPGFASPSPALQLFHSLFDTGAGRVAARVTWDAVIRGRSSPAAWSSLQRDVASCVDALCEASYPGGPPVTHEHVPVDVAQSLDVAWPAIRCSLEVDGPLHFAANTRRPLGATRLKRQLLRHAGWTCASVPFYDWDRLNNSSPQGSSADKQRYLADLFRSSGIHDALERYCQHQRRGGPSDVAANAGDTATPSSPPGGSVMSPRRRDELAMARLGASSGTGARAALRDALAARVARSVAGGQDGRGG